MNKRELKYFKDMELGLFDATSLPFGYLLKSLLIKMRRKTWGRYFDKHARVVWTVNTVSDVIGPADNVRNYYERQTIRQILSQICRHYPINTACEVGCGYGRLIMVLKEFARDVIGFEREEHLIAIAKQFLPTIRFHKIDSLDNIFLPDKVTSDFTMTCTVLQHITDEFCQQVLNELKRITPKGHVLLIEKTKDFATTQNINDGNDFISRAREPELYARWMKPFNLISVTERIVEPGYYNPSPGSCMLFRSP